MSISTCIATTSTQLSAVAEIRHPDTQTNKQTDYRMRWGSAHQVIKNYQDEARYSQTVCKLIIIVNHLMNIPNPESYAVK